MENLIKVSRPNRDTTFAIIAKVVSLRATCLRAKVGAVIVKDKRIVSIGYNGALPGENHCSLDTCVPDSPCTTTIHAEVNAIFHAAKSGIPLDGATIYCTHSPCQRCSEAIIQTGIKRLVYIKLYRETPFTLLERNLKIDQIDESQLSYFIEEIRD